MISESNFNLIPEALVEYFHWLLRPIKGETRIQVVWGDHLVQAEEIKGV